MKRKAICMVLSDKVHHNEFLILDSIDFKNGKTKPAVVVLKTLEKNVLQPDAKAARSMLIITDSKNELAQRALRNVAAVSFIPIQNINIVDLLKYRSVIMTKAGVEKIEKIYAPART